MPNYSGAFPPSGVAVVTNESGKPDYIPDPNAVREKVDVETNTIIQYKKAFDPTTRTWREKLVGLVDGNKVRLKKKRFTVEEKQAHAINYAKRMGMSVDDAKKLTDEASNEPVLVAKGTSQVCGCGFVSSNDDDFKAHQAVCANA